MRVLALFISLLTATCFADSGASLYGAGHGVAAVGGGPTYLFRYNADHASGDYYAYTNSGAGSLAATATTASISQAQANSSPDAWLFDASADTLNWTTGLSSVVTAADLDECSIERYVYIDEATQSSIVSVFEIYPDAAASTDMVRSMINANGTVYFRYEANNVVVSMDTTATVPTQQWVRLRYRITAAGNSIGVQIDSGSWENDGDADAVGTLTADPDTLKLAQPSFNTGYSATNSYGDDFEIIAGYDTWN